MWQKLVIDRFLKTVEKIEHGSFQCTLPNGSVYSFQGTKPGASGIMHIRDWRVISAFSAKGDIGLAETYRDGLWSSDNLTNLLLVGLQNENVIGGYIYGGFMSRLVSQFMYLFTRNTLGGSKRNIHAHYDLGNEFYKLWLDPSMSYSAALFQQDGESLESAQYNKYDRMLGRLETSSGQLLEIGCGWGGLAERATTQHNFNVKGITLSEEQHTYATKRLNGNADIVLEDYRHQQGKYDSIISIEMFEAVGEKFWPTYFQKMESLLKDKGKAVIQTITIDERYFQQYRNSGDMVRSFIFPGGMLPTPTRFAQEAQRANLQITDRFAFGKDYAHTLRHWLESFEMKLPQVRALGFDEPFIRLWRFYLAVCIAGFETGRTDVMQLELQHA